MEMTLILVIFLLGGSWETEALSVAERMGKDITITCSHANAFSNVKYFCKESCTDQDVLITSREAKKDSNEKYSIKDEGNTFYVTISDLKEDDSGTYWCGIERVGIDTYNEVAITVVVDPDKADHANASSSKTLVYTGVTLAVLVLVLGMAFLIFFRHRSRDISKSSGKDDDVVDASPSIQKQDAHHANNRSPAKKDQETDGRTNRISTNQHQDTKRDEHVYCNVTVSSEPEKQSDNLCYTTVTFKNHTECSTATTKYSFLKHKSTAESTIYSNV